MRHLWRIAREEFKMTAANKAFVVITIIGPFLIAAMSVIPGLEMSSPTIQPGTAIGVYGGSPRLVADIESGAAKASILVFRGSDLQQMLAEVAQGKMQGLLVLPPDYLKAGTLRFYARKHVDSLLTRTLSSIVAQGIIAERLIRDGIHPSLISYLTSRPELDVYDVSLTGVSETSVNPEVYLTVIGFVMILYMSVLLYGQMIGRSVVGEKVSKTAEIMLSSVRPGELLFGKIFGKGLAAILQYAFWIGIALLISQIIGPTLKLMPPAGLTLQNLLYLVLFFVLAFFLYSAAYGAIGAGAQDDQHLAQLGWPLLIFLIVPLASISLLIGEPNSSFAAVLSYFPLTSPIAMLIRVLVDPPALPQIALSVGILVATIVVFVLLAARLFRVGILMTGKRFNLREILRWAFE